MQKNVSPLQRLALLMACGLFSCCAAAQLPGIAFSHYTIEQGLPNDNVTTLAQDKEGFLWVGTTDGLARFDGLRFKVFRHVDSLPNSIPNNYISGLNCDPQGRVWVSTVRGVCWYDAVRDEFQQFPCTNPAKKSCTTV